jgi:hypothetical protein
MPAAAPAVNTRVSARRRARRSNTHWANGRTTWAWRAGWSARTCFQPQIHAFEALVPDRQNTGVDENRAQRSHVDVDGELIDPAVADPAGLASQAAQRGRRPALSQPDKRRGGPLDG